ncbi:EthD family reductase [uncultured Caulobacter sp.]|uniref:EthD family reductase n=1 Tax=uncultured Caulobacter sp. TaxID=158749 RepID=UPI002623229B|nr:EthD family reductase [uncultured Caulobacter sp.]
MAAVFTVLYPARDGARFDHAYYDAHHIPLVKKAFAETGLTDVQVLTGVSAGDGGPAPFAKIVTLFFRDAEAMQASLTSPQGAELTADLPNFTDIQPIAQISVAA